jgi:hypothetical protein
MVGGDEQRRGMRGLVISLGPRNIFPSRILVNQRSFADKDLQINPRGDGNDVTRIISINENRSGNPTRPNL